VSRLNIQTARLTGFLYLLIIIFGLIAQIFVRDELVNYGDAKNTADHILASVSWYRFGFVSEILMLASDVGVMGLLYVLFRNTSHTLAIVSSGLRGYNSAKSCRPKFQHLLIATRTPWHKVIQR
jgi:hypothetical protein